MAASRIERRNIKYYRVSLHTRHLTKCKIIKLPLPGKKDLTLGHQMEFFRVRQPLLLYRLVVVSPRVGNKFVAANDWAAGYNMS